jgi:hypothetical protein
MSFVGASTHSLQIIAWYTEIQSPELEILLTPRLAHTALQLQSLSNVCLHALEQNFLWTSLKALSTLVPLIDYSSSNCKNVSYQVTPLIRSFYLLQAQLQGVPTHL